MLKWMKRSAEDAGGSFLYLRVDDRLIHGQVVIGWGLTLDINCLVLAHDRIAANPAEKAFYLQIIPENMCGMIESVGEALLHTPAYRQPGIRCMIVVAAVQEAMRWVEANQFPDLLILGGIHAAPERSRFLDYLYLSTEEIELLSRAVQRGVKVICRDLPTSSYLGFEEIIASAR